MVGAMVLVACGPSPAWITVTAEAKEAERLATFGPHYTATAVTIEKTRVAREARRAVTATYRAENPPTPTLTPIPRSTIAASDRPTRPQPSRSGSSDRGGLIPTVAGYVKPDALAQAGCRHLINIYIDVRDYRLTMPELRDKLREVDDSLRFSDTPSVGDWSRTLLRLHANNDQETLAVALVLVAGQCAGLLE